MERPPQPPNPASAAESEGDAGSPSRASPPWREPDEELRALRRLLLTPEQEQISELQRRLDDPEIRAAEASRVLAEAVRRAKTNPELAVALLPLVEIDLQASIRRNPSVIVETIYPILGPAIRKAVASAVRGMLESLNRVVDQSFTWRGLRWRMEAWRTGQTMAEVALRHSVIYRVEQALLIHRETGLLLLAVGADPAPRDKDLVSGMLTAIQDFVHDSFSVERDQELDRLEVGDFQVWIERGPRAALAAVIRGSAPRRLRATLSDAVASIHRDMGERLERFDGDATRFEAVRPVLEDCLQQELSNSRSGPSPAFLAVSGLIVALLAVWASVLWRDSQRWSRFTQAVRSEPGLILVDRAGSRAVVFRDPLARDPAALASEAGFAAGSPELELRRFLSLDAPIIVRRAAEVLDAPESVQFAYDGGVLTASGRAAPEWIAKLHAQGPTLFGVDRVAAGGLAPDAGALELAIRAAAAAVISFETGVTSIHAAQAAQVDALAEKLRAVSDHAREAGTVIQVAVVGRADEVGPREVNRRLSERRAQALQRALQERGLPASSYSTRGEVIEAGRERTAGVEIRVEEGAR